MYRKHGYKDGNPDMMTSLFFRGENNDVIMRS